MGPLDTHMSSAEAWAVVRDVSVSVSGSSFYYWYINNHIKCHFFSLEMQDSLSQIDELLIFCFQMVTLKVPGDRKLGQSVCKAASWSGYIRLYAGLPVVPRVVLVEGWRMWEVAGVRSQLCSYGICFSHSLIPKADTYEFWTGWQFRLPQKH